MNKRLEEIKEELAVDYGWKDYAELFLGDATTDGFLNEVAKRYARECCIATQKHISEKDLLILERYTIAENANTISSKISLRSHYESNTGKSFRVDKESITNPDNIILL